jgi:poly(3-hydroxyalkanoate) synthetase
MHAHDEVADEVCARINETTCIVRHIYRFSTSDNYILTVSRVSPVNHRDRCRHSVVLCHGMASNRYTFDLNTDVSVVEYLAMKGWDVWVLELRGCGMSRDTGRVGSGWCFDDYLEDCIAVVANVQSVTKNPVHFIGHSMGGMLLQALPIGTALRSGVSIGGSLFLEGSKWMKYLWLWPLVKHLNFIHTEYIQHFLAPFSFRCNSSWDRLFFCAANVDAKIAREMYRKNFESISTSLIEQMLTSFKSPGLLSMDGTECYASRLSSIKFPMLLLAGSNDKQCPPICMQKIASSVRSSRFECLSRQNGQQNNYGHFDLIVGSNSKTEVWDRVIDFLIENDKTLTMT